MAVNSQRTFLAGGDLFSLCGALRAPCSRSLRIALHIPAPTGPVMPTRLPRFPPLLPAVASREGGSAQRVPSVPSLRLHRRRRTSRRRRFRLRSLTAVTPCAPPQDKAERGLQVPVPAAPAIARFASNGGFSAPTSLRPGSVASRPLPIFTPRLPPTADAQGSRRYALTRGLRTHAARQGSASAVCRLLPALARSASSGGTASPRRGSRAARLPPRQAGAPETPHRNRSS